MVKICPEIINCLFFAQSLLKFTQKQNLPKIKEILPKSKKLPNNPSKSSQSRRTGISAM